MLASNCKRALQLNFWTTLAVREIVRKVITDEDRTAKQSIKRPVRMLSWWIELGTWTKKISGSSDSLKKWIMTIILLWTLIMLDSLEKTWCLVDRDLNLAWEKLKYWRGRTCKTCQTKARMSVMAAHSITCQTSAIKEINTRLSKWVRTAESECTKTRSP